ncbi:MAG: substrate-binding domain-containing protein [Desulfobulbaceae bacterium]|nr:substrate-binding domain-containing protein [Desulfobulbaceae bacterium]
MRLAFFQFIFFIFSLYFALPAQADATLSICGTGDSQQLLRKLAESYEKLHPGTSVTIPDSIGSSGGIKAAKAGKCDMGRVARPLTAKEQKYGLSYLVFAYSPVVFLANNSVSGVKNLSSTEVAGIFSGNINNWQQLGGPEGKIFVANREKGDSSRSVIEQNIPSFARIENFIGETIYSSPETIQTTSTYKNTIAYGSIAMARNSNLIIFSLDGVFPTQENIKNGTYKLVTPFALVWLENPSPQRENFLAFLHTERAEEIMNAHGIVSAFVKN